MAPPLRTTPTATPSRGWRAPAVAALVCGGLAAVAAAQDTEDVWQTIFRGATEVNVVNVDVIVSQRDGQPVTGLTVGDFELLADGEPVRISNFYAVESGRATSAATSQAAVPTSPPADGSLPGRDRPVDGSVPAPENRQLHLILFVDNANIKASNRARVFKHLREFLLATRQGDSLVMVASQESGHALRVHQGFTAVAHDLFVTLDELEAVSPSSARFDLQWNNLVRTIEEVNIEAGSAVFSTKDFGGLVGQQGDGTEGAPQQEVTAEVAGEARAVLNEIQSYATERVQHVRNTIGVLEQVVEMAAGLPGRKAVLYVSDGLPLRPGEALIEAFARRFEALPEIAAELSPFLLSSRDDALHEFRSLVERANAGQVTFYNLNAAPLGFHMRGSAESKGTSGGNFAAFDDSLVSTETRNREEPLVLIAEGTGGRYGLNRNAFDSVLARLATDFDNYYSLGFNADHLPAAKRHALKVRVLDRKGLEVRHRRSFREQTVEERAVARTRAVLLLGSGRDAIDQAASDNPLRVTVETEQPLPQDDGNFVVPLRVLVPLGKLVLLPGRSDHQGRVSMFVAVRDERGRTSDLVHHLCPIRIPNADVLTALGQTAACGVRLLMRGGAQTLAVSVLDEVASVASTVSLDLDVGAEVQSATLDAAGASR